MKRPGAVLLTLTALAAAAVWPAGPVRAQACAVPQFEYRHGIVSFTEHGATVDVRVEIADTPEKQEVGLMCRRSLDPDAGMLFVFQDLTRGGFWMEKTLIPLSIAFMSNRWQIVAIMDMRVAPDPDNPPPGDVWTPPRPYRYALEVNQGFFKAHDLDERAQVRLVSGEPAKP
jgi:uncharacterized membrane protein (UPF0127 family)